MGILADHQIRALSEVLPVPQSPRMITPFVGESISTNSAGERIPSYGLSSYGYDIRLGNEFKVFTDVNNAIVDPMNFNEDSFVEVHKEDGDYILLPPRSFVLAVSKEVIRVPRNVLVTCLGKSTFARCGIYCNVTPLEPEWEGQITLEFSNSTPIPAKMYVGAGCAQLIFSVGDDVCETSYKDRNGKYQGQLGVTLPK